VAIVEDGGAVDLVRSSAGPAALVKSTRVREE